MAFWLGILFMVVVVIGGSVIAGRALSKPGRVPGGRSREDKVMALKASGALQHRKSNRN